MFRSGNPALRSDTFSGLSRSFDRNDSMTVEGTVNKTLILFVCLLGTASYTWTQFLAGNQGIAGAAMMGGLVIGLIMALVTAFKPMWAGVTAPIYALAEGLALGGISASFETRYPGIAIQAVALTFSVLAAMLLAYKTKFIVASDNFKRGVIAATGGIALLYLVQMILGFFGIQIPYIHQSGLIGIGFSMFVVILAAMNLVLDFDMIESAASRGAPKYMEWYGGFALVVTMVWLYLEILRLLAKLQDRK